MINWDKIDEKISIKKYVVPTFIVLSVVLLGIYIRILYVHIEKNIFAENMEWITIKNEDPKFNIEKIYICSSANALDSNGENKLDKLDLYQYSDIAIYINNKKEDGLFKENTVKELYIDNIDIELQNQIGTPNLIYTNLLKIGSKEEIKGIIKKSKNVKQDKIEFKTINTNEANSNETYENPTFYADCSNPISLKYINKINKEYILGKNESAIFDGTILQKAGIKPEELKARIIFKINIVTYSNEYHTAWINLELPLSDIYKGTTIKTTNTVGEEFNFFSI